MSTKLCSILKPKIDKDFIKSTIKKYPYYNNFIKILGNVMVLDRGKKKLLRDVDGLCVDSKYMFSGDTFCFVHLQSPSQVQFFGIVDHEY